MSSVLIAAGAIAAGYGLGFRIGGSRDAGLGAALALAAASGAAVYAFNSAIPEVTVVNLHNFAAECDAPLALKKEDIEGIARKYGISKQDEAFNAELCDLYCSLRLPTICLCLMAFGAASGQLSPDYYATTCPTALLIIRVAVWRAVVAEHRMGASLLRLHFHDCFVNGCDASVLLDDTSSFVGEKTAGPNAGSLRGFDVISSIKSQVESVCPGVVSCADILAVAARDSVVTLGGPSWTVQLGRRDSTTASANAANSDIPSPAMDLSGLLSAFSKKGFTPKEMVALSGAHTIGQARCTVFRGRLYNESNIDASLATSLKSNCPGSGGDNNLAPLDAISPVTFDNGYFKDLVNNKGVMHSDQQLFNGGSADSQVTSYSTDTASFFADFANAMVKMGNLSPLTGTSGQIRTNCSRVN